MFVNLSNHSSEKWSEDQLSKAKIYGDVVDIPFPHINPKCTGDDIDKLVDEYFEKIMACKDPVVMVQGEYLFTYRMINRLKAAGIKALAGCSERRTIEYTDENGFTLRRSEFEFVEFKEY